MTFKTDRLFAVAFTGFFAALSLMAAKPVKGEGVLAVAATELAQFGGKKKGKMKGGKKGKMRKNPMFAKAPRDVHEKAGLFKTGLRAVFPTEASCLEVSSPFGYKSRYDGSPRVSFAYSGYHNGMDISAEEGTPVIAIADGEVVHKYEGGKLVGYQIFLRHAPADTGLPFWTYSKYKHFQSMPEFEVGDRVTMGQVLAPSGITGTTGGYYGDFGYPSLHISIYTSDDPNYLTREKWIIPKNVKYMDPVGLYLDTDQPVIENKDIRDLPDDQKDVVIPYMTPDGTFVPEDTRLIWPFACTPR